MPVSVKGGISVQKKKGMNVKGKQLLRKPAFFCDLINGGLFNGRQRILPHMLRGMPEVLGYSSDDRGKSRSNWKEYRMLFTLQGMKRIIFCLWMRTSSRRIFPCP